MTSEKTIKKSKLIKLLSTFSTLEWKRFGRFVQSPYHNTNQTIVTLYTILKKAFPFEINKELEQERLYKKIYGKEVFKLSKFQNLCSDLYELATDFMVDVYLTKEKRKKKKLIVDMLSERNYDLFKGASQQLIKEVETQEYLLDSNDFLLLFQLHDALHHHVETEKYAVNHINFDKTVENLSAFYVDIGTQLSAEQMGIKNYLNNKNEIEETGKKRLRDLFQMVIDLHQDKETEIYFELKNEVLGCWDQLKTRHKTNLLLHLINFSFTNIRIQKEFGHKESFYLYKIGVENQLFVIDGKIGAIEFMNIGILGFSLDDAIWTDRFIKNHQQYLAEESRAIILPLIYAYKANFQKKYKLVIELLSTISSMNQLIYLPQIKSLLIRAYFEGVIQGEEYYRSPLDYEIESFKKMMLRNNKLSKIKIDSSLNFLVLVKELSKIYRNDKRYDLEKIHHFESLLKKTQPLLLRKWLSEKLVELKTTAFL